MEEAGLPMRSTLEVGTTRRCLAALLSALLASGSLAPTLAFAQQNKAAATKPAKPTKADEEAKRNAARAHYAGAEEKLKAGDYAGAYEGYKAANDLLPAPITMFKMALCQDELGKVADAISGYEAFLASTEPGSSSERATEAERRIAELKKKLPATVALKSDPAGASIEVDGAAAQGVTPIDLELSPGRHTLRITLPGYDPAEKELDAAPGGSHELALTLTATPVEVAAAEPTPSEPSPAAEASAPESSNLVPYVLLGLAGAGVITGGVFGVKAMQAKSDFDKGEKTAGKADEIDRSALVADMAFGAALTFGVTGLVLLLTNDEATEKSASKARNLQVAPYVSPQGAGAGAFLQF